jgi:hypothetical protein
VTEELDRSHQPVLRREVSRLCGGAAVDVTVADVELPPDLAALLEPA